MGNLNPPPFRFKQFSVSHHLSSMRVNTDGVLLGAWAAQDRCPQEGNVCQTPLRILDIGTGCGVIALMAAQRFPQAQVEAIDLHAPSVAQAAANFAQSPWASRLNAIEANVTAFTPAAPYDLILSNPPFFQRSLPCAHEVRTQARHSDNSLSLTQLFAFASRWLTAQGLLALVLPAPANARSQAPWSEAPAAGLYLRRCTHVYTRPHKAPERVLLEFSGTPQKNIASSLVLYKEEGNGYGQEYLDLVRDFYLFA